jgi:ABC-type phosphate/phosphonate transport system ATPase subunit
MERLVIVGCGGSGKATLARRLGATLDLRRTLLVALSSRLATGDGAAEIARLRRLNRADQREDGDAEPLHVNAAVRNISSR